MRAHGQHVTYVFGLTGQDAGNGCRCDLCRRAAADYERKRARRIAPAYVSADEARRHIRMLQEAGLGLKTIARRAGVSTGGISKLMFGNYKGRPPSKRIRVETRNKILAVMPIDAADGAKVDATRTWENIDTLLKRGWTKAAIARAISGNPDACNLQLSRHQVEARNARAVEALLDEPVPPRRSRHGMHPVPQPAEDDTPRTLPDDLPPLPKVSLADQPWRARAACRLPSVPAWLFFPGRGDYETTERAKAVCRTCPVAAECLDDHLHEREGIWGGTSAKERRELRRERRERRGEQAA